MNNNTIASQCNKKNRNIYCVHVITVSSVHGFLAMRMNLPTCLPACLPACFPDCHISRAIMHPLMLR